MAARTTSHGTCLVVAQVKVLHVNAVRKELVELFMARPCLRGLGGLGLPWVYPGSVRRQKAPPPTPTHAPHATLSGTLPLELGSLASLRELHLENNTLSGSVPDFFADMKRLRELRIANTGQYLNITKFRNHIRLRRQRASAENAVQQRPAVHAALDSTDK